MTPGTDDDYLAQARQAIRAEAAVLDTWPAPASAQATPSASGEIARTRLSYALHELTDAAYLAFVEGAFRALLKRRPTSDESAAQLGLLGAGASKVEILGNLRWSGEGRHIGVHVHGLWPRYLLAKAVHIPLLGHLFQTGMALAGLPHLVRQQRAIETLAAAGRHEALQGRQALDAGLGELRAQAAELGTRLRQAEATLDTRTRQLQALDASLSDALRAIEIALRQRIEALEATPLGQQEHWIGELTHLRQRIYAVGEWFVRLERTLGEIDARASSRTPPAAPRAARAAAAAVERDAARAARNAAWATYLAGRLPAGARVLALACGADWLELLALRGLDAGGADLLPAMDTLRRCNDGSMDGVAVLALPLLARTTPVLELLAQAARVLRPGGALLLADAPEPDQLIEILRGTAGTGIPFDLLECALAASGFEAIARIDSADGRAALLAHRAAA